MREITFHEEADSEVQEAALYYEDKSPNLGLAFLDELDKALRRIMANPLACRSVGEEIRQALVGRFPYSILYTIETDDWIRVIAVAHQKRRPEYWWKRL